MRTSALAVLISFLLLTALHTLAQDPATPAPPPQTGVVLVKLSPPIYPPLARQARIIGDVRIQVSIRKDGSVESAEVISGHPMLKSAALESAQKSQFECKDCEGTALMDVTYTFDVNTAKADPDPCCCSHERPQKLPAEAQFRQLGKHIVVTVDPGLVCMCPDACTARWAE